MHGDPFLDVYTAAELRIASEFLSNWIPFLSRGLCRTCTCTLSDRVRSLASEVDVSSESLSRAKPNFAVSTPENLELKKFNEDHDNCVTNSLGSWKEATVTTNDAPDTKSLGSWKEATDNMNDTADVNSLGSWKDGANDWSTEAITSSIAINPVRKSWADMADELGNDDESEVSGNSVDGHARSGEVLVVVNKRQKPKMSRDEREFTRFNNVKRKKDFICMERFKGKIVNILEGLELHTGVFSAVEQKRIVDFVYTLQEMGKKGDLKDRTYTAPQKWMRGKGRVTIQFGCCYNYATDKSGNPPGILQNENVDPIPHLFKVMIRRLVRWHVLPPSCVPDSCIVNIYDEGDCIPPHIDNHDFVRPFCTVSFLSKCNILFGSNLKILAPGEFEGPMAIPLPVGSVLVLNGNGADVAKHCVPAVPTKRISITFRKMDELKRPHGFVLEPDLQRIEPLSYETDKTCREGHQRSKSRESNSSQGSEPLSHETNRFIRGILETPQYPPIIRQQTRRDNSRGSSGKIKNYSEPQSSLQYQPRSSNRRRNRRSYYWKSTTESDGHRRRSGLILDGSNFSKFHF